MIQCSQSRRRCITTGCCTPFFCGIDQPATNQEAEVHGKVCKRIPYAFIHQLTCTNSGSSHAVTALCLRIGQSPWAPAAHPRCSRTIWTSASASSLPNRGRTSSPRSQRTWYHVRDSTLTHRSYHAADSSKAKSTKEKALAAALLARDASSDGSRHTRAPHAGTAVEQSAAANGLPGCPAITPQPALSAGNI